MKKQRPQMSLRKRTTFLAGLQEIKKPVIHDQNNGRLRVQAKGANSYREFSSSQSYPCPPTVPPHPASINIAPIVSETSQNWETSHGFVNAGCASSTGELGIKQLVGGFWPAALSVPITLP